MAGTKLATVGGVAITVPPDDHQPGDAGHILDHNNMADVLTWLAGQRLIPTARQTAACAASPRDLVVADTSGGAFTVSLPAAPGDMSCVGVILATAGNPLTVSASGADTLNGTTAATLTLDTAGQAVTLLYSAPLASWYVTASSIAGPGVPLPVPISDGGTGASTRQAALDALAGATTAGRVLAGDGTHVTLRALAAADIPPLAYQAALVPTPVKTAAYTAAPGDLVPVDTTAAGVTITLPAAPPDRTQVGVKLVTQGAGHNVNIATSGTDVLDVAGGFTSTTIQVPREGGIWQYSASSGIWYKLAAAFDRSQLDARYAQLSGAQYTGRVVPAVVTLTDAATIAVDASLGNDFRVTLGGNRTLGSPSNPADGQAIRFWVTQDATGGRALSFDTAYEGADGLALPAALSATAGRTDLIAFIYNAAKAKWCLAGYILGFA